MKGHPYPLVMTTLGHHMLVKHIFAALANYINIKKFGILNGNETKWWYIKSIRTLTIIGHPYTLIMTLPIIGHRIRLHVFLNLLKIRNFWWSEAKWESLSIIKNLTIIGHPTAFYGLDYNRTPYCLAPFLNILKLLVGNKYAGNFQWKWESNSINRSLTKIGYPYCILRPAHNRTPYRCTSLSKSLKNPCWWFELGISNGDSNLMRVIVIDHNRTSMLHFNALPIIWHRMYVQLQLTSTNNNCKHQKIGIWKGNVGIYHIDHNGTPTQLFRTWP